MSQIITATYENGVLRPDQPLAVPAGTRVHLVLVEPGAAPDQAEDALWDEFERLSDELTIDSGGLKMTRDQLHERR